MLREHHSSAETDHATSGRAWTIVGLAIASWALLFAVVFAFQVLTRAILG